ncbi:hypothetical protein F8M41_025554 [Gigaspora margarita]|uniref:F-box domain-containing protein n=1 Tax=Gigaspora margarita TaxID=4874 RepID=A0A8H4B009_GIGMA|nr:hypothetical protein F8M41_025554 [Gigaspora margarita]
MASKIFRGDMPELMEQILNNLDEEICTLYSCVLVSRHWCMVSIPILWRDPFTLSRNSMFITRYFTSLKEDDRFILNEYEIDIDFSNNLFHYAIFLKVLDLTTLDDKVQDWIDDNLPTDFDLLKYRMANLLIKLFIESGATLSKSDLVMSNEVIGINPEIFYLLGQNKCFFLRIQDLSVSVESKSCIESAIALLKILASHATKIITLTFDAYIYDSLLYHTFTCVIKSQEQLRHFELFGNLALRLKFYHMISALQYQKRTLKEVSINSSTCNADFEALKNCENLEVIRISYCEEVERLLKILGTNLYKINTLEIYSYTIDALNIIQILKKSSSSLQRLKLYSEREEIDSLPLFILLSKYHISLHFKN